jgi:N-acetylglucosaminyldiphosphoundecaprenol N-acetyl-beta-D-mannosaminyltransferase
MCGPNRRRLQGGHGIAPTELSGPQRVNVLGVGVSLINMERALDQIDAWVSAGSRTYVCVCSVHGVMECQRSDELRAIVNRAGMTTPDGMPLVWLGRSRDKAVSRVYGPDLMLAELARSVTAGHRHFFYGGGPGIADRLASTMRRRFPGLKVVGTIEPPFAPLEQLTTPETAAAINAAEPDIVWVGISTPKQERWMAKMRGQLNAPVLIGVGAAFDFHSGTVRQAPRWMQRSGLEWLFRLVTEPRRLWRRYLVNNPWFVWAVALQRLGIRRYEL